MTQMLSRAVSVGLIVMLAGASAPVMAQSAASDNSSTQVTAPELPDSPGSLVAKSSPQTQPTSTQQQAPAPQQSSTPAGQKNSTTQPSGTAVAPPIQTAGGAASKPAGVAIAPPKQRRVHSWLIKFGFIAGAGAALGTVAALSAASPGRVPGSH